MVNLMTPGCCRQQFWRTNELRICSWYSYTKIPTRIPLCSLLPPLHKLLFEEGAVSPNTQSIRFLQLPNTFWSWSFYSHFRIPSVRMGMVRVLLRFPPAWGIPGETSSVNPNRKPKPLTKLLVWRKKTTLPIIPKPQSMTKSWGQCHCNIISLVKTFGGLISWVGLAIGGWGLALNSHET